MADWLRWGDEKYEEMRSRTQAATAEHAYSESGAVAFDSDYLEIIIRKRG